MDVSSCDNLTVFNKKCNENALNNERAEWESVTPLLSKNHLYPTFNDPDFNVKIALKKEFNDAKYDGPIQDVEEYSNILNKSTSFELQPHQLFVKTFLSSQTPYKSLLLYHGLGSGKTCSAIGICEEHRDSELLVGSAQKIIVIASPNVQDNFRLQLFDKRKLKKENGEWNMDACIGNKLLRELNVMHIKSLDEDGIAEQVKDVINTYYDFMGYIQFANMVDSVIKDALKYLVESASEEVKQRQIANALKREFNNKLIVIDEVHNLRIEGENPKKDASINLMSVVRAADNVRLLLLSATPMYNNYTEIIWLLNLMNANDRRSEIRIDDVFYKNAWKKGKDGALSGKELFIRKCMGYISFVRGENPYTFPFRIYPSMFRKQVTETVPFFTFDGNEDNCVLIPYPKFQMNGLPISVEKHSIKLTLSHIGVYQMLAYKCIMYNIKNSLLSSNENAEAVFENMESFGYTLLQKPLEALNIVFPIEGGLNARADVVPPLKRNAFVDGDVITNATALGTFSEDVLEDLEPLEESLEDEPLEAIKGGAPTPTPTKEVKEVKEKKKKGKKEKKEEDLSGSFNLSNLIGKKGLKNCMNFEDTEKAFNEGTFEYKPFILKSEKRGRFFAQDKIGKYSSKIAKICDCILNPNTGVMSEGIILIYSQYIYSGLIPMALALEEMGFTRYGQNIHSTLFKTPPRDPLVQEKGAGSKKKPLKYVMITGDKRLSKNNDETVKSVTADANSDGHEIKIVLISKAGSEGLDFKAIRQIHIIDPWYNMNRIEQIIGRGVRNFSHKNLPFAMRNVEIFLHATLLKDKLDDELTEEFQREDEKESADVYVYRVAEKKAIQIGMVSRVLKENAVDCIINHEQSNFVQANFAKPVKQELSVFGEIDYQVGDAPYSSACDYMETCEFKYELKYTTNPEKNAEKIDTLIDLQEGQKQQETAIDPIEYDAKINSIVNDETYVSKFALTNLSKIMQKIKEAYKVRFFYKKSALLLAINGRTAHPLVQIYAALNAFINNKQEYISDKYGRSGNLVNVGDYYMFQPIELTHDESNDLSIFERITPIDYKHQSIRFNHQDRLEILPRRDKKFTLTGIDEFEEEGAEYRKRHDSPIIIKIQKMHQNAIDVMDKYAKLMDDVDALSSAHMKKMIKAIVKGTDMGENLSANVGSPIVSEEMIEWTGFYGVTMHKLFQNDINETVGISIDDMKTYLVHHIVDVMHYLDKVSLLNYLWSQDEDDLSDFEKVVKDYVEGALTHKYKQKTYAILYDGKTKIDYETGEDENRKIYTYKSSSSEWVIADMTDEKRVIEHINSLVARFKEENVQGHINPLLGFIGYEKLSAHLLFKIKDINNLRNLAGARCDQFSKSTALVNLNKLVMKDYFTNENTTGSTEELCIMLEMICRHFSASRLHGKIWFLPSEYVEIYNIEHCKMNNSKFECDR